MDNKKDTDGDESSIPIQHQPS